MIRIGLLFCFLLLTVTACTSSNTYAPVVNGWRQSAHKSNYYIVQPGDTIYSIAWAFNMDYRDLAALNHLTNYHIVAGQQLRMAPLSPVATKITQQPRKQLVQQKTKYRNKIKQKVVVRPAVAQYSTSTSNISPKYWQWPAKGRIVQAYSAQLGGNRGIDIAGKGGEPILAAASGIVVYSGSGLRGYGKLLIIKHSDSYLSAYAFNKTLLTKEGMRVHTGQKIAEMGQNNAGKTMLHFEIRRNGQPVDPLHYLK